MSKAVAGGGIPTSRHERTFLTPCAQHSRRHPTPSEGILWEALRGRKLGAKFRRQVILGSYIVDFLAPEAKLVVEVDGASHQWKAAQDAARDRGLAAHGMRVVRVKAWHVERELETVLTQVRAALRG